MTNFFVKYAFAPFILIFGLIGNPMGLIVFGRKKFINIKRFFKKNYYILFTKIKSILKEKKNLKI
jgi:hypothetical protein